MKHFATFESPYGSPGSWNALTSPSNSDMCVCMPEPNAPEIGLGMNVACTPRSWATWRTTVRNVMTLSAIVSASV